MIFLPVAERELRVAARKRSTFRIRIVAALVAIVLATGVFLLASMAAPFGGLGGALFSTLTWLALAGALSAGLFFTSDSVSEEKREGTLGFLFLTDLRGWDIVTGKLFATSLRVVFGLMAVGPVLAATLLLGGVTGGQFWMKMLALLNATLVSAMAGLFVSSISRESSRALGGTMALLVLLVATGPALDGALGAFRNRVTVPVFSLSSPGYLFVAADRGWINFWPSLIVNQLVFWILFAVSSFLLPRAWQDKARRFTSATNRTAHAWRYGGDRHRQSLRTRLLAPNPVVWLACRERWQAVVTWVVSLLAGGAFAAMCIFGEQFRAWMAWSYIGNFFMLALYFALTAHAARVLFEMRRSGLLELVLGTPLSVTQIIQGFWRGMVRTFAAPLVLCLLVELIGTFLAQHAQFSAFSNITIPTFPPVGATTNTVGGTTTTGTSNYVVSMQVTGGSMTLLSGDPWMIGGAALMAVIVTFTKLANLAALAWYGLWSGLRTRGGHLSTLKTFMFVQVIPYFVVSFASALVIPMLMLPRIFGGNPNVFGPNLMIWYPLITTLVATVLFLGKDAGFIVWSRRRLHARLRDQAAMGETDTPRQSQPPPIPSGR